MNIISKIQAAGVLLLGAVLLSGCSALQQSATNAQESRVVTLADGRTVVVKAKADPSASAAKAAKTTDNKTSAAKTSAAKTSAAKTSDTKSSAAKAQKAEKKLTPPKAEKVKKPKKEKKNKAEQQPANDRESFGETNVVVCADDNHLHNEANANVTASEAATKVDVAPAPVITPDAADEFNINGEWTIYSVRGNLVSGEERPYITIDLPAKRFYGNNGCNYINGNLEVAPGRELRFTNMIATMKMCQNDQYQYLINLALNDVVKFVPRFENPITFLDLKDTTGRVILVLRRHNMDFLNGAWKVEELNGQKLVQEDDATMTFDTTDLKIHGTTGCNIFNGDLFIDPDKTNSLQIIGLATTKMMCGPDSRETEFLVALEDVETAKALDANTVVLYSSDGSPLFKLSKLELRDPSYPAE